MEITEADNQTCSTKKDVLKSFAKFTGKHLCQAPGLQLYKKETLHRCFLVIFLQFLRTPFLQNTFGQLLLNLTAEPTNMLLQNNDAGTTLIAFKLSTLTAGSQHTSYLYLNINEKYFKNILTYYQSDIRIETRLQICN